MGDKIGYWVMAGFGFLFWCFAMYNVFYHYGNALSDTKTYHYTVAVATNRDSAGSTVVEFSDEQGKPMALPLWPPRQVPPGNKIDVRHGPGMTTVEAQSRPSFLKEFVYPSLFLTFFMSFFVLPVLLMQIQKWFKRKSAAQ